MRYPTRNHAFVPATTWVIDGAELRLEDDKGPPRVIALAEITEVRLEFAPTRPERNRFRCRLTLRGRQTIEFYNRTYAGVYDFRDTSAGYRAFVQALTAALAQHAPGCRCLAGALPAIFWINNAILGVVAIAVIAAMFFFITVGNFWVVIIKLLLVAFYTPVAVRWFQKNRPREFVLPAIPQELLPAAET